MSSVQSPTPTPPPSRGFILDLVDRLLKWLDRPWKALAFAGFAMLVALGYGGWLSQDALIDIWKMSSGRPVLKRSEVPDFLKLLRAETGADIVALWALRLGANAMDFEDGIGPHGTKWDFIPHRIPAIRDPGNATTRGLADIMAGHIVCRVPMPLMRNPADRGGDGDLFNRRMVAEKISRMCIIPVPPAPNILVGVLLIAWINEPDHSSEEAALGLARETAAVMVSRWE